ncbi:hypothetical protein [Hyphomicrobium sp.]|uniref:hypothetical protein n=1 Tax=Hyphomicrobium sp. TaxID=82 RepID=UPI002E3730F3|nr:hypothetical protein [Hyphomicrobium sp.]HEX2841380.1 hypothetical protein [Hyphomicrobium sp.]
MSKALENVFEKYRALPLGWQRYATAALNDLFGEIEGLRETHKEAPKVEIGKKEVSLMVFDLSRKPPA